MTYQPSKLGLVPFTYQDDCKVLEYPLVVSPELVEGHPFQSPMVRQAHHERVSQDFAIVLIHLPGCPRVR